ncbi:MAG: hypothetical protein IRZ28_01005 [Steroidobacteraceae bacterium]|nr:hypothetical protein [Steroidobacteraceae bacterium]
MTRQTGERRPIQIALFRPARHNTLHFRCCSAAEAEGHIEVTYNGDELEAGLNVNDLAAR